MPARSAVVTFPFAFWFNQLHFADLARAPSLPLASPLPTSHDGGWIGSGNRIYQRTIKIDFVLDKHAGLDGTGLQRRPYIHRGIFGCLDNFLLVREKLLLSLSGNAIHGQNSTRKLVFIPVTSL